MVFYKIQLFPAISPELQKKYAKPGARLPLCAANGPRARKKRMTDQDLPEGAFWEEQLQPVPQHPLQPEQPPLRALRSWLLTMRINTTSASNATMAVEKFISYRSFCSFFRRCRGRQRIRCWPQPFCRTPQGRCGGSRRCTYWAAPAAKLPREPALRPPGFPDPPTPRR